MSFKAALVRHQLPRLLLIAALHPLPAISLGQSPAPTKHEPLGGPTVQETKASATLVHREMGGALVRLDQRPEEAALDLLALTAEERTPAEAIFKARSTDVRRLLNENYELFIKLQNGRQGGAPPQEMMPLLRDFRRAAAPLLRSPLSRQVAETLPAAKQTEYTRLVDEYLQALSTEEGSGDARLARPQADADAAPPQGLRARARVEINLLLRETGRMLKSIVDERKRRTEDLIALFDVTPEQEAEVRKIIRETGEKAGFNGETNRDELFAKIARVLTPEQRRAAREKMRERDMAVK